MPKMIQMDEIHLEILIPPSLTASEARAIRRTLNSKPFQKALRCTLQVFLARYPALTKARINVTA